MNNDFAICVRKRPCFHGEDAINTTSTTITVNEEKVKLNLDKYKEMRTYDFDYVYSDKTQTKEIYQKNIQNNINGSNNFICYTFGETGSGKTHTLFGPDGLIELSMNDLVTKYGTINVSSYEIYKDQLYDLLNKKCKITMCEQGKKIMFLGLTCSTCNKSTINKTLETIKKNRRVGESSENYQSSRSHCIVNIVANRNNYYFVDLAGSEKASKSICNNRKGYHEMGGINLDIFALKECIRGIKKERMRIPFRETKLTMVLREAFFDQYKSSMIVTISPEKTNVRETLNILSYANDFKISPRKPKINYVEVSVLPEIKSPVKRHKDIIQKNMLFPPIVKKDTKEKIKIKPTENLILPPISTIMNSNLSESKKYDNEQFESDNNHFQIKVTNDASDIVKFGLTQCANTSVGTSSNCNVTTNIKKYNRLHKLILKELDAYNNFVILNDEKREKSTDIFGQNMSDVLMQQINAIKKIDKDFPKKFFLLD